MRSTDAARFIIDSLQVFEGARDVPLPRSVARILVRSIERLSLADGDDVRVGRRRPLMRAEVVRRLDPDPLRGSKIGSDPEPIHVFVPMHMKDAWFGHLAVSSIRRNAGHPLRSLTMCLPDGQSEPAWAPEYGVTVVHDSEILGRLGADRSRVASMPGWFVQQVLKFVFAYTADAPTLVHDADTVLLRPRVWIAGDVQILPVRRKSAKDFARSTAAFLQEEDCLRHSSSVTHYQLMQPRILHAMFGDRAEAMRRLGAWVEAREQRSEPSEYQLYGSSLRLSGARRWVPAGWRHAQGRVWSGDIQRRDPLSPDEVSDVVGVLQDAFRDLYGLTIHARG